MLSKKRWGLLFLLLLALLTVVHFSHNTIQQAPCNVESSLYSPVIVEFDKLFPLPSAALLLKPPSGSFHRYILGVDRLPDEISNFTHLKFILIEKYPDYYVLHTNPKKALPRRLFLREELIGDKILRVPSSLSELERFLEHGTLISCVNLTITRERTDERVISLSFVDEMAKFRDLLHSLHAMPFLFGGSLLGWYRECSLIPHTLDVDFALSIKDYSPAIETCLRQQIDFQLSYRLGKPLDSLELVFYRNRTKIDLFFLYPLNFTQSFVSGLDSSNRKRYRWVYPVVNNLCSAILLDRLFHVPCNVEEFLEAEYGSKWQLDFPSSNFTWNKSHRNVQELGTWSDVEWNGVYDEINGFWGLF